MSSSTAKSGPISGDVTYGSQIVMGTPGTGTALTPMEMGMLAVGLIIGVVLYLHFRRA